MEVMVIKKYPEFQLEGTKNEKDEKAEVILLYLRSKNNF